MLIALNRRNFICYIEVCALHIFIPSFCRVLSNETRGIIIDLEQGGDGQLFLIYIVIDNYIEELCLLGCYAVWLL
jgi:hypothetical protein